MASMTRVKHLERILGSGACPQCGGGGDEPFDVELNVEAVDNSDPEDCEVCRRPLTYVVRWGPDDETAA